MSLLDIDEALIDLAQQIQFVYSPLMDTKTFPENVAVTLVEGAVANEEQQEMLKYARKRTTLLVSLGDCAVTGNVTALRNAWSEGAEAVLTRAFLETSDVQPQVPVEVPKLLPKVHPLHEIVKVDFYVPGCPPSAELINYVISRSLRGLPLSMEGRSKYG